MEKKDKQKCVRVFMNEKKTHCNQHTMHGTLEVICGPMFSGKSEELIRRLRRAKIAQQKVITFKPQLDNRYALEMSSA